MPVLTIRLDEETHKMFRIVSAGRGETMQDITVGLIRQYLDKAWNEFLLFKHAQQRKTRKERKGRR